MGDNEWVVDDASVLAPARLAQIKAALEQDYIIVEHRHYAGGSSKDTLLFGEYESFVEHLATRSRPGDLFYVYAPHDLFEKKLYILRAKYPDDHGRTPKGGPY